MTATKIVAAFARSSAGTMERLISETISSQAVKRPKARYSMVMSKTQHALKSVPAITAGN